MDNKNAYPPFFKSIIIGLFAGVLATIVCLLFNAAYKSATNHTSAEMINVLSLIFIVNLIFLCIGILHFFLKKFKGGELIYIALFVLLTILCIWKASSAHPSANAVINSQFKNLLEGVIIINGIFAFALIPFLFHSKKFENKVIGKPEA